MCAMCVPMCEKTEKTQIQTKMGGVNMRLNYLLTNLSWIPQRNDCQFFLINY